MRWAVVLLALGGCGGGQTVVHYAPPMPRKPVVMPIIEEPKLDPVRKPDALAQVDHAMVIGEPAPSTPAPAAKSSKEVIREGRAAALLTAEEAGGKCGMQGDHMVCRYEVGHTYEVYTCAGEQTRIELAPGERVLSDFHFGPNRLLGRAGGPNDEKTAITFWNLSQPEQTGDGRGNLVTQYFVLPANDRTLKESYLQFGTLIGPYRLKLIVLPQGDPACVASIRWRHQDLEVQRLLAEQQRRERRMRSDEADDDEEDTSLRNITCASGAYKIWVAEGSPTWVPTQVSHICVGDHPRVTIQFPRTIAWTKAPTLATDGGVASYRMIPEDHTMVVNNLFSRAKLSMGSDETGWEVVYIQRLKEPN